MILVKSIPIDSSNCNFSIFFIILYVDFDQLSHQSFSRLIAPTSNGVVIGQTIKFNNSLNHTANPRGTVDTILSIIKYISSSYVICLTVHGKTWTFKATS